MNIFTQRSSKLFFMPEPPRRNSKHSPQPTQAMDARNDVAEIQLLLKVNAQLQNRLRVVRQQEMINSLTQKSFSFIIARAGALLSSAE